MSFKNFIQITRLNQPVGILLLFLPCLFGIILSFKQIAYPKPNEVFFVILIFMLGSVIMRSAGCIINDLMDQKLDKQVERTKSRPLASGKLSRHKAILLLITLLGAGLAVLLQLNAAAIFSGFVALILVATYPLMKRITYYPQIFLGMTFNFGILMSSLHILGNINFATSILYGFAIIWTLVYDTIYAHQDIADDLKVGIKSSAIKFGKNSRKILMGLNFTSFAILILLGWHQKFSPEFFLTILLADFYLNAKIKNCDFNNPSDCSKTFKSNVIYGFIIALALLLG